MVQVAVPATSAADPFKKERRSSVIVLPPAAVSPS
jgi:hypothetical protein